MPPHLTLYAYVDGADLEDLEKLLVDRFDEFVASRQWICSAVCVVNQRGDVDDPDLGADEIPDWDLGLNFALPHLNDEPLGWFEDVESTANFLGQLNAETGRDFVIGIGSDVSEDLFFVTSPAPDLHKLRAVMSVASDRE